MTLTEINELRLGDMVHMEFHGQGADVVINAIERYSPGHSRDGEICAIWGTAMNGASWAVGSYEFNTAISEVV